MGFTTPCFIRKNTANIRNRLKELGYYCNPYLGWHNLCTYIFGITSVYSWCDDGIKNVLKYLKRNALNGKYSSMKAPNQTLCQICVAFQHSWLIENRI